MTGLKEIGSQPERGANLKTWRSPFGLVCVALCSAAIAQAQSAPSRPSVIEAVSWTLDPIAASSGSSRASLTVRGTIRDGWHVYGFKQAVNGPTPLVVSVEQNVVATAAGVAAGSAPTVAFDPAFGFVTPYYARNFSVTVPVRLRSHLAPGRQVVPLSIRYQSCDGRICLPPKTAHLSAPVNIRAKS